MTDANTAYAEMKKALDELEQSLKHFDELTPDEQEKVRKLFVEELWPYLPNELKQVTHDHA